MRSVAIVTTCKDRLPHLRQTLPLMTASGADEVVLVDYGCPQGSGDWAKANFPDVRVVSVDDDPSFCLTRARNLGASATRAEWLLFVDADVLIQSPLVDIIRPSLGSGHFLTHSPDPTSEGAGGLSGTVAVEATRFQRIAGYDEVIRGWGAEDKDFYRRLILDGLKPAAFPPGHLASIAHDNALRVRYQSNNMGAQRLINRFYSEIKLEVMRSLDPPAQPSMEFRRQLMNLVQSHADSASQSASWPPVRIALEAPRPFIGGFEIKVKTSLEISLSRV